MKLDFNQLTAWQQQTFAAALLQRMLPNYRLFSEACQFGDYSLLHNLLDIVWQMLSKQPVKMNFEVQLEKLELVTPDPHKFDLFAVYPALDACSAMICLLQSLQDKDTGCAEEVSQLSRNSVQAYLQVSFIESTGKAAGDVEIDSDPLMVWEEDTQEVLFNILQQAQENKQTCDDLKAMVCDDRLSNLGIEY